VKHSETLVAALFVLLFLAAAPAQTGLVNQAAPKWDIKRWIQLPAGKKTLEVADFKGKVVHIFAFQSW